MTRGNRFSGLILGTAVGDALGLPFEGLGRRRIARLHEGRWRHRFLFGRGFVSDDTNHTLLVALSLIAAPRARERFEAILARRLRWWLVGLPLGAGRATYLSILRLWLGFPPSRSGIHSAGNGPAMRSAAIGAFFADDRVALDDYVEASTRITHTDPRALVGARAVALVAALIVATDCDRRPEIDALDAALRPAGEGDAAWSELCDQIRRAATDRLSVADFAGRLGLGDGVSGFIYHTVPVAIYAWHAHWGDFEATPAEVLEAGGDTDTVVAPARSPAPRRERTASRRIGSMVSPPGRTVSATCAGWRRTWSMSRRRVRRPPRRLASGPCCRCEICSETMWPWPIWRNGWFRRAEALPEFSQSSPLLEREE